MNTPVFFSREHGLISVSSGSLGHELDASIALMQLPAEVSLNESTAGNLSLYNINPDEVLAAYQDTVGQLKAAFIFHVQNQKEACRDILEQLFFSKPVPVVGIDTTLDKAVLAISRDLLDDIPAGDPRWTQGAPVGLGSSYSMQILHQLEDKQRAYSLFARFLHETELWGQLCAVTIRDGTLATVYAIGKYPIISKTAKCNCNV